MRRLARRQIHLIFSQNRWDADYSKFFLTTIIIHRIMLKSYSTYFLTDLLNVLHISGMFRCYQSYCIPLFMVCDNIADCQRGQDEAFCTPGSLLPTTEKSMNMEGLLRCRHDNIYIPSFHICDGVVHCLQSQVVLLSNTSSQLILVYNKAVSFVSLQLYCFVSL